MTRESKAAVKKLARSFRWPITIDDKHEAITRLMKMLTNPRTKVREAAILIKILAACERQNQIDELVGFVESDESQLDPQTRQKLAEEMRRDLLASDNQERLRNVLAEIRDTGDDGGGDEP